MVNGPVFSKFVLNCTASTDTETDWGYQDAVESHSSTMAKEAPPASKDLRRKWWGIRDQGRSGACVGFAVADGLLRWHYSEKKMIKKTELPSPRFIWMANKETDNFTRYPTTFLESAGTSTKLALGVAQRYGCVMENTLPMSGKLAALRPNVFYGMAAQFRINSYYNLGADLNHWRSWIATSGPILTRLDVDETWKKATSTNGVLEKYVKPKTPYGGHAVCLVGYTQKHFIVRNSWGPSWGNGGFAFASNDYAKVAFTEAYGAVI